jgi:hypothetical protein
METILFIKLILAAIGAGVVVWHLFIRGREDAEREVHRWLRRRDKERNRDRKTDTRP